MAAILKLLKPMQVGIWGMMRFAIKHYYFFVLAIVLIPTILGSINQAIEERNPLIPPMQLGLVLVNADAQIAEDVISLNENPEDLIGSAKPSKGMWKTVVYYWGVAKVILREMGLIWAIALPFVIIFKILRHRNQSESGKNLILTIIYGLIFVFVINLILIIVGLISGDLVSAMPEGVSLNRQALIVLFQALPFHGLISLVGFIINLNPSIVVAALLK